MRINKFLSMSGAGSRRKCEEYVIQGRVKVNGEKIYDLSTKIDPDKDNVHLDNQKIMLPSQNVYYAINKPKNVICTVDDPYNRPKITDYISDKNTRLFPIGRLDYDSEGLILLTNDGDLCYRLTHPKFEVEKIYLVTINSKLNENHAQLLEQGVELAEGKTAPAKIKIINQSGEFVIQIIIHQGWNRQIRRMFEKFGYTVNRLIRTQFGPISLDHLKSGKQRKLSQKEIQQLRHLVQLE